MSEVPLYRARGRRGGLGHHRAFSDQRGFRIGLGIMVGMGGGGGRLWAGAAEKTAVAKTARGTTALFQVTEPTTLWSTTLSAKVNFLHTINVMPTCCSNLATQRSKPRTNETLELHRVNPAPYTPNAHRLRPRRWGHHRVHWLVYRDTSPILRVGKRQLVEPCSRTRPRLLLRS